MNQKNRPIIRRLSEADAEEFWQLRLRALKEEPESFGASYIESKDSSLSDVQKRLQHENDAFVLGAFAPHLLGMVGFYRRTGLKMRHKGNIWGMYVAPEGRGIGVGRALMLAAIRDASAIAGLEHLELTVVTTNIAACELYRSLGFRTYGIEPRALKLEERYLDEELMSLPLPRVEA